MTRSLDHVADVVRRLQERPPTLGSGRLVCVDGPAGSGKTRFTALLVEQTDAAVVHLDDVYEGWAGLETVGERVEPMLRDLAAGRAGSYRRYDWVRRTLAEIRTVPPAPILVLEGVGAGARAWADLTTVLVWLDAPVDVRRRRALARDGDAFAPYWDAWADSEARVFARDRTRDRADVRIDTG